MGEATVRDSTLSELSVQISEAVDEMAKIACFGSEISESTRGAISPWLWFKPTRCSRTRARSSLDHLGPSSAFMMVMVAPRLLDTFATIYSDISKVRDPRPSQSVPKALTFFLNMYAFYFLGLIGVVLNWPRFVDNM